MSTKTEQQIEKERIETLLLRRTTLTELNDLLDFDEVRKYIKIQNELITIQEKLDQLDEELLAT